MSHPIDPFIALSTGGKFYPLGPDPERIDIRDIAHSLSNQCRYAGHTSEFWSVAAHSLEVSYRVWTRFESQTSRARRDPGCLAPEDLFGTSDIRVAALCGLLHDASEAYLQDIVRPIKPLVHGYAQWEASVERAVAQKFDLPHPWSSVVKMVDDEMVLDEVASFFPEGSAAWRRYGITPENRDLHGFLVPLPPKIARDRFIQRFDELMKWRVS